MSTRDAIDAVLTSRQAHWASRDAEALGLTHADDGIVRSPMFATVQGRTAITNAYRSLFRSFVDWNLATKPPIVEDLRAAQPFDVSATHTGTLMGFEPTGRRFDIHGVLLFEFTAEGLIAREERVYDFTGLLIQVGVLRGKPAF